MIVNHGKPSKCFKQRKSWIICVPIIFISFIICTIWFVNPEFMGWSHHIIDDDNQQLHFLHIPKTGGKSFQTNIESLDINTVETTIELSWPQIQNSDESHHVISIFRNPRHHLVSMWKHCRESIQSKRRPERKLFKWVEFSSWLSYWSTFDNNFNGSFERYNLDHYKFKERPDYEPFGCGYIPVNLQSTRLGVFDEESAIKRIEEMYSVAVQDMYRESVCVLEFKVKGRTTKECLCDGAFQGKQERHGVQPYDPEDYLQSAGDSDIAHLTKMDQIVYYAAKARLIEEIKDIQSEHDPNFLCVIP